MNDEHWLSSDREDQLGQAGQALFRLVRLFGRTPMRTLLQKQSGQPIELSRILVTEAVATGAGPQEQEVTVGTVAERLGIDPSTASRLTAETVAAGYLTRLPSQIDSRRQRLEMTNAGRELVRNAHTYQRVIFEHITRDWSEAERANFAELLIKFVTSAADDLPRFPT